VANGQARPIAASARFARHGHVDLLRTGVEIDPGTVGPIVLAPQPVDLLRSSDLVFLRCSFVNLRWGPADQDGAPTLIRQTANRSAYLVVTFPAQHIIERAFFETAPGIVVKSPNPETGKPKEPDEGKPSEIPPALPPVFASLAGGSRLVFRVTDEQVTYTTEGILAAMSRLELAVAPQALPPIQPIIVLPWIDLIATGKVDLVPLFEASPQPRPGRRGAGRTLPVTETTSLVNDAIAIARVGRTARVLESRFGTEAAVRAVAGGRVVEHLGAGKLIEPGRKIRLKPPLPEHPSATETAIELPWRLIVSPNRTGGWAHSQTAVERDGRTELWHTRLGTRGKDANGLPVILEGPSPDRTIRALWARDWDELPGFPFTPTPADTDFPNANGEDDRPKHRTSLNSRDRMMLVHETSNFHLETANDTDWPPEAVPVERMMLSTLGGWLESRVQFLTLPAVAVSIEEWKHLATMGRDHEVKVVYAGFLLPFGHRASLVKVTERKIYDGPLGRVAYAFQRMFIIVRQPEKEFTAATMLPGDIRADLAMPLKSVRILTRVTPDLDEPVNLPIGTSLSSFLFVPFVKQAPFQFKMVAVDRESNVVEFRAPLTFMERPRNAGATSPTTSPLAVSLNQYNLLDAYRRALPLNGQRMAFADSQAPDDTTLVTNALTFDAIPLPGATSDKKTRDDPQFLPVLHHADAVVPAMSALAGAATPVALEYPAAFKKQGFTGNAAEVFLALQNASPLEFAGQSDRSGGFVTPSIDVTGLSRLTGPIGGNVDDLIGAAAGLPAKFKPANFFAGVDAKLFGVVELSKLLGEMDFDPPKLPKFVAQTLDVASTLAENARQLQAAVTQVEAQAGATATTLKNALNQFLTDFAALLANPTNPPATLKTDLDSVVAALGPFAPAVEGLTDLPRAQVEQLLAVVRRIEEQLANVQDVVDLLEQLASGELLPEVVSARLDWSTDIPRWPSGAVGDSILSPVDSSGNAIANGTLTLAVDLQAPTSPGREPTALVSCSITPIDIRLIGPSTFLVLHFQTLEFSIVPGKKPDVNVRLREPDGVEFAGPLQFVNTLRDVIPFDGFSDPPYLDVTAEGIEAGFDLSIPNLSVGIFSLENISLGAHFSVPFIAESLEVGFNFCSRENPFRLSVMVFAGGGFFGVTVTPAGVKVLEVALEFGAAISINFGVASGGLSAMAGIYFKIEIVASDETCVLEGYFRLRGEVDVLGLISASIELYLSLTYETSTKSAVGRATLTIEVEVMFFSTSVDISCEKKFAGADDDPTFEQQMGPKVVPAGSVRPWDEYCLAFA
jgi:hypothetical protein